MTQAAGRPAEAAGLVVRYFEELFNERRVDAIDEVVAASYVEHATAPFEAIEPGPVHGPTLMADTLRWLIVQFPDLRFRIEAIVTDGDTVAVRVLGEGTNRGPIGPIPATGRRFSSVSCHWFRVADGRLAEHWATRDDLTTMIQLRIVAGPGRGPARAPVAEVDSGPA